MPDRLFTPRADRLKIVASGGLGDCLLITPFIRFFRKSGWYKHITMAMPHTALELFDLNPHIDQTVPCRGRDLLIWTLPEVDCDVFAPYDEGLVMTRNADGFRVEKERPIGLNLVGESVTTQLARRHGLDVDDLSLEIFTSQDDEAWADRLVSRHKGAPMVFLNPYSNLPEKNYPHEPWAQVVDRLQGEATIMSIPTDGPSISGVIYIQPSPSLRQSAALFRRVQAVLTVDSFPGHLAAATGTPAVVLFGPSNPLVFGHPQNINLRSSPCPPCADTIRLPQCRIKGSCVAEISPGRIVEAVRRVLGS